MPVIVEVPPLMLLIVFPLNILLAPELEPSVSLIAVKVVAPVKVIFEIVLFEYTPEPVFGDEPFVVMNVTVPPAPVFVKPVTIALFETDFVPLAGIE
jgi:hypothetical protein